MTWGIDYTARMKSDLVGIKPEVNDALTELIANWKRDGPTCSGSRAFGSMKIFEE